MDGVGAFDGDIDELLGEYQRRRGAAGDLQRQIREITGTASAPRQSVKVTVSVQGEVTALEFPTGAFKRMAPKELADAVLGAIGEAKGKAMDAYKGLMGPHMPGGLDFMDLIAGNADLTAALPVRPPMPEVVRDYIQGGRSASRFLGGSHA
jgi:DNA-binding protein YbaB